LTNIQCALGISQLSRLDDFLTKRRGLGELYSKTLSLYEHLFIIPPDQKLLSSGVILLNSYWVYPIICKSKSIKALLEKYLVENDIQIRPFFYALDHQPVISGMVATQDKSRHAIKLYDLGLYLPLGNGITFDEVKYVTEKVKYCAEHIIK
jgi:perosamine synthetase